MTITILAAGLRSTIQDRGRTAHLRGAIPQAGPADPVAFEAAQRLVGNDVTDAAIEIVGTPFRFTLDAPRLVAATGRDVRLRTRGPIAGWTAVFVRAGEEITVEGTDRTRFAYLALSGGIALPPVLGSRATYLPAAIGPLPRPLASGDQLPLGSPRRGAESAGRTAVRSDGPDILPGHLLPEVMAGARPAAVASPRGRASPRARQRASVIPRGGREWRSGPRDAGRRRAPRR